MNRREGACRPLRIAPPSRTLLSSSSNIFAFISDEYHCRHEGAHQPKGFPPLDLAAVLERLRHRHLIGIVEIAPHRNHIGAVVSGIAPDKFASL